MFPIPIRISYTNPHSCLHTCVKNLPIFIFYLDFRVKTCDASIAFFVENTLFQWSSLRSIIPSNGVTWLNSRYRIPDLSRKQSYRLFWVLITDWNGKMLSLWINKFFLQSFHDEQIKPIWIFLQGIPRWTIWECLSSSVVSLQELIKS